MAARRLVLLMLALLLLSSLLAALAPVSRVPDEDARETTTDEPPPRPERPSAREGELVRATYRLGASRPQTTTVHVGDQLQLRVTGERVATIVVGGTGASDGVGPLAPAEFDLLLDEPGEHPVRVLESRELVGTIRVEPAPAGERAPRQSDARPPADAGRGR